MRLTVAICTWNRAELLRQTLDSLSRMIVPEGVDWELLVIDNGCTDHTQVMLASWNGHLPMRTVVELTPGKSSALNRAVAEATGDYILFTDDDVLVDPSWMRAYHDAFCAHPEAAVFGGPITPWFEGDPPNWLRRVFHRIEYVFAALNLGEHAVPLQGDNVPFGANMAVGRRYDTELGPRRGNALRGEEITLVKSMLADGFTGWWVPEARVRHHIPKERQTIAFVREWYRGWGSFTARTEDLPADRLLLGRPLWVWRERIGTAVRYRVARAATRPAIWTESLKEAAIAEGRFSDFRP